MLAIFHVVDLPNGHGPLPEPDHRNDLGPTAGCGYHVVPEDDARSVLQPDLDLAGFLRFFIYELQNTSETTGARLNTPLIWIRHI